VYSLKIKRTLVLACCLLASGSCLAQLQQKSEAATPAFEVATIRANPTADPNNGHWSLPSIGSFNAIGLTLAMLIRLAYDIDDKQILNRPKWLNTNLYDVNAKPEEGITLTRAELRPRLQLLLQQRFHLVAHRDTRDTPGFALVEAKHGAKLQPTKGAKFPNYHVELHAGKINLRNSTLNDIAASITSVIDKPVLNRTNIQGSYDIDLTYSVDETPDSNLPSLFTAIEETLGLRLTPQKVSVEVLIIDSVDSMPTPN
jgi:uncharacterized protein (TIGR03435 family)